MTGNPIIDELLSAFLKVLIPALVAWGFAKLLSLDRWVSSWVGERTWAQIQECVRAAVLAAEQNGLAGHIKNIGLEKKQYAIDFAQNLLRERGIDLDLESLADLIEATLLECIRNGEIIRG